MPGCDTGIQMTKESLFDRDVLLRKPRQEARTNPWVRTIHANKKQKPELIKFRFS